MTRRSLTAWGLRLLAGTVLSAGLSGVQREKYAAAGQKTTEPSAEPPTSHVYDDLAQQHEAAALGIWVFMGSEVLLFSGLFLAYAVYAHLYPHAFAVGSSMTEAKFGTINTALLLTSSATVVLAVRAAREGWRRTTAWFLWITATIGFVFLIVKGLEYRGDLEKHLVPGPDFPISPPEVQIFFSFYWVMTALHAAHVFSGITVLTVVGALVARGRIDARRSAAVSSVGLYWGLVDIFWIFLYPLLYLVGRSLS